MEQKEYQALERAMTGISASVEGDWRERVEEIRKMDISSRRIRETRDLCVRAYETYADAMRQLTEARRRVDDVERAIQQVSPNAADEQGRKASIAVKETDRLLDQAEFLVAECAKQRQSLQTEFGRK